MGRCAPLRSQTGFAICCWPGFAPDIGLHVAFVNGG
jgi:hypothetical protein